jgi:hypothetical protein
MRHQLATQTDHFTFAWYDEVGTDAEANLDAVVAVAEDDLATLAGWFGLVLPANFRRVDVRLNWTQLGAATNGGYQPDLGINLSSPPRAADPAGADEWVRAMFVMELAEILMSYRDQTVPRAGVWNAGDSVGEGLSRVMGAELHPTGYYGHGYQCLGSWTAAGGADYVSTIFTGGPSREDGTFHYGDQYWPAFGCAAVFLYFLHAQLGHSWESIITATGTTLQEKYAALGYTSDGYTAMRTLLLEFYPDLHHVPTASDNPFPLTKRGFDPRRIYRIPPDLADHRPDPSPLTRVVDPAHLAAAREVMAAEIDPEAPQTGA